MNNVFPIIRRLAVRALFLGIAVGIVSAPALSPGADQCIILEDFSSSTLTYTHRVRIQPAMPIDEGTVDAATAVLAEVLDLLTGEQSWLRD